MFDSNKNAIEKWFFSFLDLVIKERVSHFESVVLPV